MCKNAMDTDSTNSADSQEAIPTWNKFEESHEATPAWASNHGESHEATPAWASNPGEWDQDSATRLAEKLLQVQIEATPSCFSSVGDTNREVNYCLSSFNCSMLLFLLLKLSVGKSKGN